ncbi:MAG: hypothetical protein IJU24_03505 [Bacteroidaceae bacterium]|jgi:vancomycin permeability regulator SanA|nr:hypothetical protein [Bacteroidaceae bacterium]
MRPVFKPFLAVLMLMLSLSASAQRSGRTNDPTLNRGEGLEKTRDDLSKMRNQSQNKNSRQENIYMFAASFSLIDSVLFVSDVQKVDDVIVNNKWFVKERASFETQFTDHVRGGFNESYLTSIYFSEKSQKMNKRRAKLIKRNARKNGFNLVQVSDFKFVNPDPQAE